MRNEALTLTDEERRELEELTRRAAADRDEGGWFKDEMARGVSETIAVFATAHGVIGFQSVGWSVEPDGSDVKAWVVFRDPDEARS